MPFAENLKKIPPISHIEKIELMRSDGSVEAVIENRPGQTGSLAVYNYLAQKYGTINPDAAREGLDLFAEHHADAKANPGKHPNIDRLMAIVDGNLRFTSRLSLRKK